MTIKERKFQILFKYQLANSTYTSLKIFNRWLKNPHQKTQKREFKNGDKLLNSDIVKFISENLVTVLDLTNLPSEQQRLFQCRSNVDNEFDAEICFLSQIILISQEFSRTLL